MVLCIGSVRTRHFWRRPHGRIQDGASPRLRLSRHVTPRAVAPRTGLGAGNRLGAVICPAATNRIGAPGTAWAPLSARPPPTAGAGNRLGAAEPPWRPDPSGRWVPLLTALDTRPDRSCREDRQDARAAVHLRARTARAVRLAPQPAGSISWRRPWDRPAAPACAAG